MNAAFEQWVDKTFETYNDKAVAKMTYQYLDKQKCVFYSNCNQGTNCQYPKCVNPHLLREDVKYVNNFGEVMNDMHDLIGNDFDDYLKDNNPRPTDMEQEAREMLEKHHVKLDILSTVYSRDNIKGSQADRIITTLTEFGKMWYERGREEQKGLWMHGYSYYTLKQQLAEKDEEIAFLREGNQAILDKDIKFESELTAAKAEIERLKERLIRLSAECNITEEANTRLREAYDKCIKNKIKL